MNDGQMNLVRHCTSDFGRHAFVSGGNEGGPNVFYRCTSTHDQSDVGPHMRWAVGQLYDNVYGGQMRVWDRGNMGSGHGWSGNTIVFWNSHSLALEPPTTLLKKSSFEYSIVELLYAFCLPVLAK